MVSEVAFMLMRHLPTRFQPPHTHLNYLNHLNYLSLHLLHFSAENAFRQKEKTPANER